MTCRSYLTIGGHLVAWCRDFLPEWYFERNERVVRVRTLLQRNSLYQVLPDDPDTWSDLRTHYLYAARADRIKPRLEKAGFNRQSLEADFARTKARVLGQPEPYSVFLTAEEKKAKVEAFRNASLEDFLAALSFVITHRVGSALGRDEEMKLADPLVRILVGEALPDLRNGLYVNFPCQEMDNFVVAMFEVLPGDAECAADATELVEYGALQDFNDLISSDI